MKANPALVPALNQIERQLERVPFDYIPKAQVAACEPRLPQLDGDGVRVLKTGRHTNKLKPGHLRGNRFRMDLEGPGVYRDITLSNEDMAGNGGITFPKAKRTYSALDLFADAAGPGQVDLGHPAGRQVPDDLVPAQPHARGDRRRAHSPFRIHGAPDTVKDEHPPATPGPW